MSRAALLTVLIAGLLAVLPTGIGPARAEPPAAAAPADQAPWIDNNAAFFGCLGGAALGALMVGYSPVFDWVIFEGWMTATYALATRMSYMCFFGIIAGAVYSIGERAGATVAALVPGGS